MGDFAHDLGSAGDGYNTVLQKRVDFSQRSTDLLSSDTPLVGFERPEIHYDTVTYIFHQSKLPSELGQELKLSLKDGTLRRTQASHARDFRSDVPVGCHDLIKDIRIQALSNCGAPWEIEFSTVNTVAGEHFNKDDASIQQTQQQQPLQAANGRRPLTAAQKHQQQQAALAAATELSAVSDTHAVSTVIMPFDCDFASRKAADVKVVERHVTEMQLGFLQCFPNHTVDTLDRGVAALNTSEVVIAEDEQTGYTPVVFWMQNDIKCRELFARNRDQTMIKVPRKTFEEYKQQARGEIERNIPLGDVTSGEFSIRILPLPVAGKLPRLGSFEYQCPGIDMDRVVARDAENNPVTALEKHEATPMVYSGRITVTYKKVHAGDSS